MNQQRIDNMVLTVINDGNGDQCGLNYAQRCDLAEHGGLAYFNACCRIDKTATFDDCCYAGEAVQDYYRQHVAEIRANKGAALFGRIASTIED